MIINYGKTGLKKTHSLPGGSYASHALAAIGAVSLHGGVAVWASMPDSPQPLPQQQVIQISMVAPSIIAIEPKPQPVIVEKTMPKSPPQKKGMIKAKPQAPKIKKPQKIVEKKIEPQQIVPQKKQTQVTSGRVSQQSQQKHSAITKPLPASYLNNPPPQYPASARRRKQQGVVMVDVLVAASGKPKHLTIGKSSGIDVLDEAALAAVRKWMFVPAKRGSEIIEASVRVPIKFRLN